MPKSALADGHIHNVVHLIFQWISDEMGFRQSFEPEKQ